jgi:hypothetical protein
VQGVVLMRNCPVRSQGEVKEGGYWDTGPINRVKEPLVLILGQAPSKSDHTKAAEAQRHTLTDLIERYTRDVLPHKGTSIASHRTQQLCKHAWAIVGSLACPLPALQNTATRCR